jgi:hypothetical protein
MTRPTDTDRSAALTALVVHLRDDQHMQWKQIAYRVHISESSAMRRHERVTTRARIAELERQNAELVAALAVHEERIVELRAAWWGLRSFDPFGDPEAQQRAIDEAIRALIGEDDAR